MVFLAYSLQIIAYLGAVCYLITTGEVYWALAFSFYLVFRENIAAAPEVTP